MGTGKKGHIVHIIDFGLGKRYRDPQTGQHIPPKEGKSLTGTARYASVNTHLGLEQGRRDDMESIAYVLLYLLKGKLPWMGIQIKSRKEKAEKVKQIKVETSIQDLCKGQPKAFVEYLTYVRGLAFEDLPDYKYL